MNFINSNGFEIKEETITIANKQLDVFKYQRKRINCQQFKLYDLFIQENYLRKYVGPISEDEFYCLREKDCILLKDLSIVDDELLITILSQLIEALQNLYKYHILGRVISFDNILWNFKKREITLMEYGLSSPLIFEPPELKSPKYNTYGIEIDSFLIGRIVYFLTFRKDLPFLTKGILNGINQGLKQEISNAQISPFRKEILLGLLKFHFNFRWKQIDLINQINKYTNNNQNQLQIYQISQNEQITIEAKIYFRESMDGCKYQFPYKENSSSNNISLLGQRSSQNKIKIIEQQQVVDELSLNNIYKMFSLQLSKIQCLNEVLGVLLDFEETLFIVPLTIYCIRIAKVQYKEQIQTEIEKTRQNQLQMWEQFQQQYSEFYTKNLRNFNLQILTDKSQFNTDIEMKKIQQNYKNNLSSEEQSEFGDIFRQLQQQDYKSYTIDINLQRKIYTKMYLTITDNPEFTVTQEKLYILLLELILLIFIDILFQPNLPCYNDINNSLYKLDQIKSYLKQNFQVNYDKLIRKIQQYLYSNHQQVITQLENNQNLFNALMN